MIKQQLFAGITVAELIRVRRNSFLFLSGTMTAELIEWPGSVKDSLKFVIRKAVLGSNSLL